MSPSVAGCSLAYIPPMNSSRPEADPTTIDDYRTPPKGATIFFGLVALAGLAALVRASLTQAVASCHGEVMAAGASCTTGGRRTADSTATYDEVLAMAEDSLRGQQLGGLLVLLGALVIIGLLVSTWWRDVRMAEGLSGESPELAHADRGLMAPVAGGVVGLLLLAAGGWMFFRMSPVWGAPLILVGLVVLVMARPRGATALLLYPTRLVTVSRGSRHEVAYSDVQHYVGDRTHSFNWVGSGRGDILLAESESPQFRAALAERTHTAWAQSAPQRLTQGEVLDLGDVTLQRDVLSIKGTKIPLTDLTALQLTSTKEDGTVYAAVDRSGATRASVATARVANTAVLRSLLASAGVAVPTGP